MNKVDYRKLKPDLFSASGHVRLTRGLFEELSTDGTGPFSLHDWHEIYVQIADPTEYETQQYLINNWQHWLFLRENQTLKPIFDEWAEEVKVALESRAYMAMKAHMEQQGGTAAAKWLAEGGTKRVDNRRKNRKHVEEVEMSAEEAMIAEDAARLGAGEW